MSRPNLFSLIFLLVTALLQIELWADEDEFLVKNSRRGVLTASVNSHILTDTAAKQLGFSQAELNELRSIYSSIGKQRTKAEEFWQKLPESPLWNDDQIRRITFASFESQSKHILTQDRRIKLLRLCFQREFAFRLTEPAYASKFGLTEQQSKKLNDFVRKVHTRDGAQLIAKSGHERKGNIHVLTYQLLSSEQRSLARELCGTPVQGDWLEYALDAEAKEQEADSAITPATLSDDFP